MRQKGSILHTSAPTHRWTHTQTHRHAPKLEFGSVSSKVGAQAQIYRDILGCTFICRSSVLSWSLWFLCLYGWAWATESSCPRGSGVRKYWSRQRVRSVGCLGHATLIFMSAQRNGITPFLCQPLCFYVCVCVCVRAWQKQWGDKRTQPCLELCHFVISHYFMLSVCSLHLSSHYLIFSWQFSLFICFFGLLTAKLLPQSIHSTAHEIQHRNILVGKRMHQKCI